MKSYIFQAHVRQEASGQWNASIKALPGCATTGSTKEDALEALQIAADEYVKILVNRGEDTSLEREASVIEGPTVAVVVWEQNGNGAVRPA